MSDHSVNHSLLDFLTDYLTNVKVEAYELRTSVNPATDSCGTTFTVTMKANHSLPPPDLNSFSEIFLKNYYSSLERKPGTMYDTNKPKSPSME
jgi:hypothetical protein